MKTKLSTLGIYLRKQRLDLQMSLKQMADDINISSAMLSSIETGKREIKEDVAESLVQLLRLNGEQDKSFWLAVTKSREEVVMNLKEVDDDLKYNGVFLARNLNVLSEEGKRSLSELVRSELAKRSAE